MTRRGSKRALSPDLRRPAGFTLLEVMVALGILAASLLAISEVVGGALRNQERARQLGIATVLARGKMVEVVAYYERKGFKDFDEGEDGTFDDQGHPEVRWKVEVKKSAREVRLTVSWKGGGAAVESFDVVTHMVVLQPEEL